MQTHSGPAVQTTASTSASSSQPARSVHDKTPAENMVSTMNEVCQASSLAQSGPDASTPEH
eukprot:3570188-Karenia_brevis.AAC.1